MPKPDPRRLDPGRFPCRIQVTTRFADLDPNGHVNNLAIAAAIEDGRVRMFDALGRYEGARRIILSLTLEFLGEADHSRHLDVFSGVLSIGRTSWTVEQFAMQGDTAVAWSTATLLMMIDGKPRMPGPWREGLRSVLASPLPDEAES